jgi:hypothetical protein
MAPSSNQEPSGSWDSIHVFESSERGRQAHYKLTSTIMLQLTTHQASEEGGENERKVPSAATTSGNGKYKDIQFTRKGEVTLSGSMTRQVCRVFSLDHGSAVPFLSWLVEARRARQVETQYCDDNFSTISTVSIVFDFTTQCVGSVVPLANQQIRCT